MKKIIAISVILLGLLIVFRILPPIDDFKIVLVLLSAVILSTFGAVFAIFMGLIIASYIKH